MLFTPADLPKRFDADLTVASTGATKSQLEHFVQEQLIVPAVPASRRGVSRQYDVLNLLEVAVAAELLATGIPVRDMHNALSEVRKQHRRVLFLEYTDEEGPAEILLVHRKPLSALQASPHLTPELVPIRRQLLLLAKDQVFQACLPLAAMVVNLVAKVRAFEQWQASKPGR